MTTATVKNQDSGLVWSKVQPWLVVSAAAFFFFFQFIQINMLNSLSDTIYHYFHTDSQGFAHIAVSYFYGNVLLLFPAGVILDHFSTRKVLLTAMFLLVLATIAFGLSHTVTQAEIARFLCGVTGAFCLLGVVRVASRWFPPTKMAFVVGLAITFAMTGGMVAQTPVSELVQHYGFTQTIMIDAALGVVFFVIMLLFLRDYPAGKQPEKSSSAFSLRQFFTSLSIVVRNRQNWLAGLYASLINLPVFLLGASAADMYLQEMSHLTLHDASLVSEGLFIGLIIGCPLFGWWSDRIHRRKLPMFVGVVLSIMVIVAIMSFPQATFISQLALFFLLGLSISSQTIAYPLVAESNCEKLTGSANAIASLLIMSGGFLIPVFTYMLNSHWNHKLVNGVPWYGLADFHHAFMMMPIAFAVALLVTFFLKETHCKSYSERSEGA
jgi:MFS family permease